MNSSLDRAVNRTVALSTACCAALLDSGRASNCGFDRGLDQAVDPGADRCLNCRVHGDVNR